MLPVGFALLSIACGEAEQAREADRVPRVAVVAAAGPEAREHRTLLTTLEPARDAVLALQLGGTVAERVVEPGSEVREGETILRLDAREASAQLRLAEAGLVDAEVALAEAWRQHRRLEELGDGASEADRDAAQTGVHRLEAARNAAQAQRDLAAVQLERMTLRAPFDGRLASLGPERGEIAAPGVPVARVVDDRALVARVGLVEDEVVRADEVTWQVRVGGRIHPARLDHLASAADPRTLTWEAELTVDADLPAGVTAEVEIALPVPEASAAVPVQALRPDGLAVVVDGAVELREAEVVTEQASLAWVTGVVAGEQVVIRGPELVDGMEVVAVEHSP